MPKAEIAEQGYDLSLNRYKELVPEEVQHRPPLEILAELRAIEQQILQGIADPDAMRYLRIAQADLAEARRMVELSAFPDSSIGFLLRQACEKALKSWIHSLGGLALFPHDLLAHMD